MQAVGLCGSSAVRGGLLPSRTHVCEQGCEETSLELTMDTSQKVAAGTGDS